MKFHVIILPLNKYFVPKCRDHTDRNQIEKQFRRIGHNIVC